MFDSQADIMLSGPSRDVIAIAIALGDLERSPVVQVPRLTLGLGVELCAFGARRGVEIKKSAGGVEHVSEGIKQHTLLSLSEMAQKETD
jgi:hypothetical protein